MARRGRAEFLSGFGSNIKKKEDESELRIRHENDGDGDERNYKNKDYQEQEDQDFPNQPTKIDKNYQRIASQVASIGKNEQQREAIGQILVSRNGIDTYELMKKSGMSNSLIRDTYMHSVQDLSKGKKPSEVAIYRGIAQRIENLGGYEEVVEQMYEDEIISERDYKNITSSINEHKSSSKHAASRYLSKLEEIASTVKKFKIAAAFILVTLGSLLVFVSRDPPTGAVIGAFEFPSVNLIAGIILVVLGLVIFPRNRR